MNENSSIQLKFDEKNTEFEQIVIILHRTRNELNKKLEKQQKEFENKINFLIQQLRNSEVKLHENTLLLRSSYDSKLIEKRKEKENEEEGEDDNEEEGDGDENNEMGEGEGGNGGRRTRTRTKTKTKKEEIKRPSTTPTISSTYLSPTSTFRNRLTNKSEEEAKEEGKEKEGKEEKEEDHLILINDLKRKLETERYRREILEKRNGELMRELRKFKELK